MPTSARMVRTMRSSVLVILLASLFFGATNSYAEGLSTTKMQGCASDSNWTATSKKLDALAEVANCGSTFSQSECRANLGLVAGGAAATLATAVAAKTAIRIRKMPKFCGLRGVADLEDAIPSSSFVATLLQQFMSPAQADACDPETAAAKEMRQALGNATIAAEEDIREKGRKKLASEYPKLAENVDARLKIKSDMLQAEYQRMQSKSSASLDNDFKEWRTEKMKLYKQLEDEAGIMTGRLKISTDDKGRLIRTIVTDAQNPSIAKMEAAAVDLLNSRPAQVYTSAERKAIVEAYAKRYPMDIKTTALDNLRLMETELATARVNPKRLSELGTTFAATIDGLAEKASSSQLVRLAEVREMAKNTIPEAKLTSRMARDGTKLLKAFKSSGGKVSFGLFGLAMAGVSQAADKDGSTKFGDRAITEALSISSVACATMDSQWATIEGDGDCKPRPRWNAKTTDFALQPEYVQRNELSKHVEMCEVIDKVYQNMFASQIRATCKPGGAVLQDDRQQMSMVISYDKDGLVSRAQTTGRNSKEFSEYDLRFSGDTFEEVRFPDAAMVSSGQTTNFDDPKLRTRKITREKVLAKQGLMSGLEMAENHFARMQPVIQYTQACCAGSLEASDPRCSMIQRGGSGKSGGSGPATTSSGGKTGI